MFDGGGFMDMAASGSFASSLDEPEAGAADDRGRRRRRWQIEGDPAELARAKARSRIAYHERQERMRSRQSRIFRIVLAAMLLLFGLAAVVANQLIEIG